MLPAPPVRGIPDEYAEPVLRLIEQLRRKRARNQLRMRYYDYKVGLKDLGISIPPHLRSLDSVLGWPAKVVDSMSRRVVLDAVSTTGSDDLDSLVRSVQRDNTLSLLLPQTHTSSLLHSVAFTFVTPGNQGEPNAVVTSVSAESATGTLDSRRRSLSEALSVRVDPVSGQVEEITLYLPGETVTLYRAGYRWDYEVIVHSLGMPVEAIPYRPELGRPFGRSRISRPVMALTDSGVRTLARTEVSAEFYNAPQRWAMGAREDAFTDIDGNPLTGWQVMLGNLLALERDEDGNLPTVGEFQQQSMDPNLAHLRMLAQQLSAESSLPLRSLGIVGDNPESGEAITEANRELELEIEFWQESVLTPVWLRLIGKALRLHDDSDVARRAYDALQLRWRDPATVSMAARGDWLTKVGAQIPGLGETSVGMEMAGLTGEQITRLQSEKARVERDRQVRELIQSGQVGQAALAGLAQADAAR